jgi:hypothetical protein
MNRSSNLVGASWRIAMSRSKRQATILNTRLARAVVKVVVLLAVMSAASSARAVQLQTGLIAYWNFDEGAGPTAFDTAPSGVSVDNGTLNSTTTGPTRVSGQFGKALSFDGVNDYVSIPSSTDLNIGANAVSVSAWVNLSLLPSGLPGAFGPIYDSASDAYVVYLDKGNNELRFKVTDASYAAARPGINTSMLSTGSWHHVAAVFDGAAGSAGTAKIYWDGLLIDTHTGNDGTGTGLTANVLAGQVARIGNDSGTAYYSGRLDDLGVWSRALSAAEIAYIANGGTGRTLAAPAPVVHWKLDGNLANAGTGGAAYDGTLVDGSGTNSYAAGRVGRALDLGNPAPPTTTGGDYTSTNYTLANQGTISLWYRPEAWYNYQTIFDNSVNGDYWECWVYGDGNLRFRVTNDTGVTYDLDNLGGPNNWYHLAVTWNRNGSNVDLQLYVDGILRSTATTLWQNPGTMFFLGGGNNGNTYGNGAWDDLRIYEQVLSANDIFMLANVPEPGTFTLFGLGVLLGAPALLRRRRRIALP